MDHQAKEYGRHNIPSSSATGDVFEPMSVNDAKQRTAVIEWLNSTLPNLNLPVNASDEELRTILADGTILCRLLNKLRPGSILEHGNPRHSSEARSENVKRFLAALDDMHLPHFSITELEKGSMKIVLECLLTLKAHFMPSIAGGSPNGASTNNLGSDALRLKHLDVHGVTGDGCQEELSPRTYAGFISCEDRRKGGSPESKGQRKIRSPCSPGMGDSSAFIHHSGHKFHEVFQMKQGGYADLPASKISELMKSNSLDNAPTQSLLSMVNGILDESINRKNGEIPHRVACLLRKVVQEIERRISTQAEHLRTQNNLFKTREEKYQSRIRVLEALANGTGEESKAVLNQFDHMAVSFVKVFNTLRPNSEMAANQLEQMKTEKTKLNEEKRAEEKKSEDKNIEEKNNTENKAEEKKNVENKTEEKKNVEKNVEENRIESRNAERRTNEKDVRSIEIAALKQEMENAKRIHEEHCLKIETAAKETQLALEAKLKEVENYLNESKRKVQELERNSQSKSQWWNKKEHTYKIFTEFQLGALKELRFASQSVRQEVLETKKTYSEDFDNLGSKMKILQDAADSYHGALVENRKLHNEIQELKGNIRVYCRVRPFIPGQSQSQTTIDYIGDNGEIIVVNPSKQGKDGRKSFKFNKVYGPRATQGDVYGDIQALVQSVLDGYNVCIFAYGQTGSGKTYTMSGPDNGSEEDWGVNYRALNDLFKISQSRKTLAYEVGVQMVEIYNEQVRDLLSNDPASKRLGILSSAQASGLAVPDASMRPVNEPSDVLGLMEIGFSNRARSSTSMNARSSRSHSVVTIHVQGSDMKSGASLRGSLHLIDLAGSERIDRSEVIGDRLKEAQHINKSLAALGDVIFSLAAKSPHVPFRNSKLTQVLQSSLGGQAKTLMFVQLNPEVASYSETVSTLKFAERVSGVELGAARTNKEASNIKELMEQVTSLKETVAKKDEEIERLQVVKESKIVTPKRSLRYSSTPASPTSTSSSSKRNSSIKGVGGGDSNSSSSFKQRRESSVHSEGQDISDDPEMLFGFGDQEYSDRLSDASHASLSIATDTDASVESSPAHESFKRPPSSSSTKSKSSSKISRPLSKISRDLPRAAKGMLKSASGANLTGKPSKKWS